MPLAATLDHVAVAVPDIDKALARWHEQLGGGPVGGGDNGVFATRQLRFAGGGRLELLMPAPGADHPNFVLGFLERFGSAVHHVTLKVPDLPAAVGELEAAGLDVVDVNLDSDVWREAFLRPSQVGGLVIQVASSPYTEEDFARRTGQTPVPPAPDAAVLRGPLLRHPDLGAARRLWELLGAAVTTVRGRLRCRWPDSPLEVLVEDGEAGPAGLLMTGTPPLEPEEGVGPAVLTAP